MTDDFVTDGGSKYVRETGAGYQAVYTVSSGSIAIQLATCSVVDWRVGQDIHARLSDDGVVLSPDGADELGTYEVRQQTRRGFSGTEKPVLEVYAPVKNALGLENGDDARVYDHPDGLEVVDATDDPRIMTDGGHRNSVTVRWYAECSCGRTLTRTLEKHEAETSILIRCSECGAEVPAREYTSPTTAREELVTDGGRPDGVEHHPDGFHSGGHYLDPAPEPEPTDPTQRCYECGDEAYAHRCICGVALCHRHQETQGGFCSDHTVVDTRVGQVPACIRPDYEGGHQVLVDAPGFNYDRPARQRLAPSTLEDAVRSRLPDALIARAQTHVQDALDELEMPAKEVAQLVLNVDDACAFALASQGDRRDRWLACAHASAERAREEMGDDQLGAGMDLGLAVGLLEQLGAHRGGDES